MLRQIGDHIELVAAQQIVDQLVCRILYRRFYVPELARQHRRCHRTAQLGVAVTVRGYRVALQKIAPELIGCNAAAADECGVVAQCRLNLAVPRQCIVAECGQPHNRTEVAHGRVARIGVANKVVGKEILIEYRNRGHAIQWPGEVIQSFALLNSFSNAKFCVYCYPIPCLQQRKLA